MRLGTGTATRRGLGMLAIVWLNLALTPCAMAFEAEHECPHGPPAGHHEMAGHEGHGEQMAEHTCASMQDACCEIADASVNMRGGAIELDDSPDLEFLTGYPPCELSGQALARHLATADPPDPPDDFRTLHKLFCVYLK